MWKLYHYDTLLIGSALFIIISGLATLLSVDYESFSRQAVWLFIAFITAIIISGLNLKSIFGHRWAVMWVYFISLVLLILAYLFAPEIANVRSWLVIAGQQFQPSEFVKIALILLFSKFFATRHISIKRFGVIFSSFVYFLIPAAFVLVQPDLGTALILFGIWFGYLLLSEIPVKYLAVFFAILAISGAIGWNLALEDYQKNRILGFLNPERDPLGVNYTVIQSKIAIGSAGLWGKGFDQGTQVQLGFLPNATTDFVFPAFVEEWGLIGGFSIIIAFIVMIWRIIVLGLFSDNNFSKLICLGSALMLILHFSVNLGSVLGLMPVIGVSLPLMSYGGSNLLTTIALLSIIQNIAKRRAGF